MFELVHNSTVIIACVTELRNLRYKLSKDFSLLTTAAAVFTHAWSIFLHPNQNGLYNNSTWTMYIYTVNLLMFTPH